MTTRLEAAELVCLLYGWTASGGDTDRDKACHQAFSQWAEIVGEAFFEEQLTIVSDAVIEVLARKRDEIHTATLARIEEWTANGELPDLRLRT